MSDDIVSRLRQTRANMIGTPDEDHYWDCHDAATTIERLNREVSVLIAECQRQKDLLVNGASLTPAEREALTWFTVCPQYLATIRGLMDRL